MAKSLKEVLESFDFNRAAIAKQRLQNLRHQGRKVRGARIANLMRAAGLKEEEMDETDLDQLDEVLNADATASDWIHDFVHSTNPKFEGKSKKERIKMALGAYYHKARHKDGEGLGEETEQIDELNRDTLKSYINKAKPELNAAKAERASAREAGDWKTAGSAGDIVNKRTDGVKTAKAKLNKEEAKLDEAANKSDIPAYLRKNDKLTTKDLEKERTQNRSHPETIKKINGTVQEGLGSAISSVFQKMKSKLKPSTQPTSSPASTTKPATPAVKPVKRPMNAKLAAAKPKDAAHGRALLQKYGTKLSSNTKAGHDSGDGHSYGDHVNPTTGTKNKFRMTPQGKYQHHDSDSNSWNDLEHKDDISVARSAVLGAHKKAAADRPVASWNHKRSVSEEFINLDEAVKTTHEDPLVTVHDKHGLHTHANLSTANHIFNTSVKHTDVHAGPVKTKDGHETKRDLTFAISKHHEIEMKKEEFQQIISHLQLDEEIVQQVLESAKKYTGDDNVVNVDKVHAAGQEPHEEKWVPAKKKAVKESYDEEGNLITAPKSFQQFMEGMTATQVRPGVTRYTGGSYGSSKGAKYGNTDYDKETLDTKDDEGEEQQKRGRGRPAGSKSGARGPRIK